MKTTTASKKIRTLIITGALAITTLLTGRKVDELAADPVGDKDCPPANPDPIQPENSTAQISVKESPQITWAQKGGTINDASCLNRTSVYGIVNVTSVEQIKEALSFARSNGLKVSIAAVRHSMGGHAFYKNAVVLDMRGFNQIKVDEAQKIITVQSGATWHQIQSVLHPKYAVKAMQSSDIFSVGGSISVNAHGMDHQVGSVGKTIRAMRVMMPDGEIKTVSRTENAELFNLIVGGYGLFGIVLDADIDITDNVIYDPGRRVLDYADFPKVFEQELAKDTKLGLMYGHLSTSSQSLLREMLLYTYEQQDMRVDEVTVDPLGEVSGTKLRRFVMNFSKLGDIPMRVKWFAEKYVEPRMEACSVSRNQAIKDGEACLVSRNQPMHDSVPYLRNNLKGETDILQEYFIPRDQFVPFIDGLREVVQANQVNLLNASVRVVHKEEAFLNYAPQDAFSIVLYVNQITDEAGNAKMRKVTGELINLTNKLNGRFFLPYQLYYTSAQLKQSYPEIDAFFAAKKQYDPSELLTNTFYEKFGH